MTIPGEFRYWENLEKPWARAARTASRAVLGFDLAPPDHVVRMLAEMYYDGDPLAEAFVEEVYGKLGMKAGRAMLDQAIEHGVASIPDAPASLVRLFEDIDGAPAWLDEDALERGARAFRRFGTAMFHFAGAITLAGYAESSVAKPLALTGAYSGASTRSRFLETVAFWINVSEPGGIRRGAPGWASAMRVRIMHVFVRRRLLAHPEWDLAAWGVPISQGDALLTLMGGSFAPGLGMQAMGFRPSVRDIEDMMHFWRYVGHLMGVRPRWFPSNLAEAAQLSFVTFVKGAHRSGEDGVRLCQSYAQAFAPDPDAPLYERAKGLLDHGVHLGYTAFFTPPGTYQRNRLPLEGILWAIHPLLRAPFIFTAETVRRAFPRLDAVADHVKRRERHRWFARQMRGKKAKFEPTERFTR